MFRYDVNSFTIYDNTIVKNSELYGSIEFSPKDYSWLITTQIPASTILFFHQKKTFVVRIFVNMAGHVWIWVDWKYNVFVLLDSRERLVKVKFNCSYHITPMSYYTMPWHIPPHIIPFHTFPCTLCYSTPYHTISYQIMSCYSIHTIPHCIIPYHTTQEYETSTQFKTSFVYIALYLSKWCQYILFFSEKLLFHISKLLFHISKFFCHSFKHRPLWIKTRSKNFNGENCFF